MDITWIVELILIITTYFMYKYGLPVLKNSVYTVAAKDVVKAINELDITHELIGNKAEEAEKMMCVWLEKHKIKIDVDQVKLSLKAAVTNLRVEISNTDAEKKIEEK